MISNMQTRTENLEEKRRSDPTAKRSPVVAGAGSDMSGGSLPASARRWGPEDFRAQVMSVVLAFRQPLDIDDVLGRNLLAGNPVSNLARPFQAERSRDIRRATEVVYYELDIWARCHMAQNTTRCM